MTRRRKWISAILFIPGSLLLAVIVAVAIIGRDEARPDDSDMLVQRLDIPDDQNGYTYILDAEDVLYYRGTKAWTESGFHPDSPDVIRDDADEQAAKDAKKVTDALDAMEDGKEWDTALAAEITEHNVKTVELFNKAMACPQFQAPKPVTNFPPVFDDLTLAQMLAFRTMALAKEGQDEAALRQAVDIVRFGHAVSQSKGVLIDYLVGVTVKGIGLGATRRVLKTTTLPPDRLKALADRLGRYADDSEGFADALRAEYEMDMTTINNTIREKNDPSIGPWRNFTGLGGIVWKPNETRRLFIESLHSGIEAVRVPYNENHWDPMLKSENKGLVRNLLTGNVVGHLLQAIMIPACRGILEQECRAKTEVAITQTLIAMKAFGDGYLYKSPVAACRRRSMNSCRSSCPPCRWTVSTASPSATRPPRRWYTPSARTAWTRAA